MGTLLKIDRETAMRRSNAKGFTLLELMIVVVIIAILASLAYYNYSRYAFRTRRADGKEMLMRVAAAQERIYSNFNAYASSITGAATGSPPAGLGFGDDLSENKHYKISVGNLGSANQTYTLTATPQGVQAKDKCKNLTLTNSGGTDKSGDNSNGNCW